MIISCLRVTERCRWTSTVKVCIVTAELESGQRVAGRRVNSFGREWLGQCVKDRIG